jgi:autotransporter-associated beta strand protein
VLGYGPSETWNVSGIIDSTGGSAQSLPGTVALTGGTLEGVSNATYGTFFLVANSTVTATGTGNTVSAATIGMASGKTLTLSATNPTDTLSVSSTLGITGELAGALAKTGLGTVTLSGANAYTGGTTISAGVLSFTSGALGSSGSIKMNGGTLQWNGSNTQDISSRLVLVAATNAIFDTNGNNVILASGFGSSTTGMLTKVGSGTLSLGGTNTYSGGTFINVGVLNFANGSLGTGNITFGGGTLQYASGNTLDVSTNLANSTTAPMVIDTNGNNVTFSLVVGSSNTDGLTKSGSGSLTLTNSNTFTGNTKVVAGTLILGNASAIGSSALDTSSTGAIVLTGYTTPTIGGLVGSTNLASLTLTGYSSVTNLTLNPASGVNATYSGIIADGATGMTLTISGAGVQTLNAVNTYTGPTIINNPGTLTVGSAGSLGSGTLTVNGILNLNNTNQSVAGLYGSGTIYPSSTSNLTITNGGSFTGAITNSGAGSVTLTGGTLTMSTSGANNYAGGTYINGGTLLANTSAAYTSATGYGPVAVSTGGILGGGTTAAPGQVGFSGVAVTINAGTTSSPSTAGTLAAGIPIANTTSSLAAATSASIGTLAIGGDLALNGGSATLSGANLLWKLDTQDTAQDLITVGGTLYINAGNGQINLGIQRIVSTASVTPGTTYTIISGATGISVTNTDTSTITYLAPDTSADITQDFSVADTAGGQTWNVEIADTVGGTYSLEVTAATPEPGSLGLLGVASLGLLRRRRTRKE